jgi:YHYH protein
MKIVRKFLDTPLVVLVISLTGFAASVLADDPRTSSWFTADTGKYARIYTNDAAKAAGATVTTWSNGTQTQSLAAYSGVQEISSSSNWVYLRSTGLGIHIMGPWQNGSFPNLPINTKTFWRIPRTNTVPASKTLTGNGVIGYFVDGVGMFDSRDAFYWNGSIITQGTGYWNRDAYVNEGATFDPAYAHQPQDGTYHYHADPIALRYLLGDHVNYDATAKTYSESTNAVTKHSPILAWVGDGCPLYGPYGYSNATNPASGVRRMVSGYVQRNGQLGTSNLNNGRVTIPQWAVRLYGNVASNILAGPAISTTYPLGCFMEDNDYLGDLGYQQGVDFDLDVYNGRWCVTPEFPGGVYAYFVAISSNGTPVFPYNIGRAYYGNPTGSSVNSLSETVVTNFEGGPNSALALNAPALTNGTVTLAWSSVEGGTYQVQSKTNLSNDWITNLTGVASQGLTTQTNLFSSAAAAFFGVALTSLATYDPVSGSAGGGATSSVPGGSAGTNSTVTVSITLPNMPPWPPANAPITSVKLAGTITGSSVSDATQGTVLATFAIPGGPTGAQNVVVTFTSGPTYTFTNGFTIH